jgi:hypothetical protein
VANVATTLADPDREMPRGSEDGCEERQMSGVVSRKDFLRLGGAGLAGAVLMSIAGCGGSREAVRFLDATTETTALERTEGDVIQGSRKRIRTSPCCAKRCRRRTSARSYRTGCDPGSLPTSSPTIPARVSAACWPRLDSCVPSGRPTERMDGISTTGPGGRYYSAHPCW